MAGKKALLKKLQINKQEKNKQRGRVRHWSLGGRRWIRDGQPVGEHSLPVGERLHYDIPRNIPNFS